MNNTLPRWWQPMPRRRAWWRGSLALKNGLNLDEPTISFISSTVTCVLPVFAEQKTFSEVSTLVCVGVCVCVCVCVCRNSQK